MNRKIATSIAAGIVSFVGMLASTSVLSAQGHAPRLKMQASELRAEILDDDPIITPDTMPQTSWYEVAKTDWYDKNVKEVTITSAEQLAGIAKLVSEGKFMKGFTFKLGNDIDLKGRAWFPIGLKYRTPFQGSFDGAGHTIKNLYINCVVDGKTAGKDGQTLLQMYDGTGLFGKCEGANIKNLNVNGVRILSISKDAATICSNFYGSTISLCTANDIKIQSAIKMEGEGGMTAPIVSAFIGSGLYSTTIEDCIVSNADVFGIAQIAGLVSMPYANVNISRCIVYKFRGRGTKMQIGGLCAAANPGPGATPINIKDCAVIASNVGGETMLGGFFGIGAPVNITNSYVSAKVDYYGIVGQESLVGAVVGGRPMMDFGNLFYNADLNGNMPAEGTPIAGDKSSMRSLGEKAVGKKESELKSEPTATKLNAERVGETLVWQIDAAKYEGFPFPKRPKVIVESTASVINEQVLVQENADSWVVSGIQGSYCMFDLGGRMMTSGKMDGETSISKQALPSGVYVLQMTSKQGIATRKLLR